MHSTIALIKVDDCVCAMQVYMYMSGGCAYVWCMVTVYVCMVYVHAGVCVWHVQMHAVALASRHACMIVYVYVHVYVTITLVSKATHRHIRKTLRILACTPECKAHRTVSPSLIRS